MNEEMYSTFDLNGRTWRCVKSQMWKHQGKDPFTDKLVFPEMSTGGA